MKKILRKELNRTVLAKEGTKWMYLTAKEFLPFFDTTQEQLKKNKKKIRAYIKDDFLELDNPQIYNLKLTKANKETRLFGTDFTSLYEKLGVCECDVLLIENFQKNGEEVFLFSANITDNIVIKKYSKKDIKKNEVLNNDYLDSWWPWDNHLSEVENKLFFETEHTVKYINNKTTENKRIKFQRKDVFLKYMNQTKGSVQKTLYEIFELKDSKWVKANFKKIDTLQFILIDGGYQLSPKKTTECSYQEIE